MKNLKYLDLTRTYIKYFDFVFELPNLDILNLSNNVSLQLSLNFRSKNLKQKFTKLSLRVLDLSYTELMSADWDWSLINKGTIEFLDIRGTRFSTWSELGMAGFTNLRAFDADHHFAYREGCEDLRQLKKLEYLDLSWLDELSSQEIDYNFLSNLETLKNLSLTGINKIKSFDFLKELKDLEILYLNRLRLTKVPAAVSKLPNLKKLFLGENELESCEGLSSLDNIKVLDLSYNNVSDISSLKDLHNIESLRLAKNNLKSADAIKPLMSLPNLKELSLHGNPLEDIPSTFLGTDGFYNSMESLRTYFASIASGFVVKNEIKLVLTGNSTAGKTSLRKLLKEEPIDTQEPTTHGIVCDTWRLLKKDLGKNGNLKDLDVHIWDFGGQEYYHATHRLFFTSRSVYILLWEKTTNNSDIVDTRIYEKDELGNLRITTKSLEHFPYEYWIETIRQYDEEEEKSPVLMVQNKIELPDSKEHIDNKSLEAKYSNMDFFEISVWKSAQQEDEYLPGYRQFKKELLKKLSQITQRKTIGKGLAKMREEIEQEKRAIPGNTMSIYPG